MKKISEFLRFKSGVYCITNLVNGKQYIGSSVNIYNRLHEHLYNLNNNKAHNKHLQAAWNKYKENSFDFSILTYCDAESRFKLEQYYIDVLFPEYNLAPQVVANLGRSISEEQRKQISETLKHKYEIGEIQTYKQEHAWIPCMVYNVYNYNLEKSCKNLKEASKFLKCYSTSGSSLITGSIIKNKYCVILQEDLIKSNLSIKDYICKNYKTCISKNGKYLVSENSSGQLIYYTTIKDCAKALGISASTIMKYKNATKNNPYKPKKTDQIIYYLEDYVQQDGAVYREESDILQQTNIGEDCDVNPEITV